LIDKNREPGVKILLSGGTRCNLTHQTDARGIATAFGRNGRFLHSSLSSFGPQQVVDFFAAEGVPTKVEPGGKVFPLSDRASDVRDALLRRVRKSGCTLAMGETVSELVRVPEFSPRPLGAGQGVRMTEADLTISPRPKEAGNSERFRLVTSKQSLTARNVVLTTGGQSYPACGTTGDGFRFAAALGHRIVAPHTALVPITSHAPWVLELQGITLTDVRAEVVDPKIGVSLAASRGSLLFAHFGVTGPVILDISFAVSGISEPSSLVVRCDLLPEISERDFETQLIERCVVDGKRRAATVLDEWFPHRVGETLLTLGDVSPECPLAELSKANRQRLVRAVKRLDIPVAGTMGFRKAELTAGGVAVDEVDSRTMESRLVPGLFFAGEVLDLNGPVGGYNFQAAFSTGWRAGESVGSK
jgi:predicted flavoprotein YhiN